MELINCRSEWLFFAMLLSIALDARAQTAPAVKEPIPAESQLVVPSISFAQEVPPASSSSLSMSSSRTGRFTWSGGVATAAGDEMSPWAAGNREAWRVTTGVSYSTGDLTFGVGLQGQHGHQLPSSMSFALGETSPANVRPPGFVDATGSRVWEARLMMKRRLSGARGGATVDAVGEAFLPLGGDTIPSGVPGSFMPIRSRSFRFGLVISF